MSLVILAATSEWAFMAGDSRAQNNAGSFSDNSPKVIAGRGGLIAGVVGVKIVADHLLERFRDYDCNNENQLTQEMHDSDGNTELLWSYVFENRIHAKYSDTSTPKATFNIALPHLDCYGLRSSGMLVLQTLMVERGISLDLWHEEPLGVIEKVIRDTFETIKKFNYNVGGETRVEILRVPAQEASAKA